MRWHDDLEVDRLDLNRAVLVHTLVMYVFLVSYVLDLVVYRTTGELRSSFCFYPDSPLRGS